MQTRRRPALVAAAAMAVAFQGAASAVAADSPPTELSTSSMACEAANKVSTRLGDDLFCRLTVRALTGFAYGTTAEVAIPAGTVVDTSLPVNFAGSVDNPLNPTRILFGKTRLGLVASDIPITVSFQLHLPLDGVLAAGDQVAPVAKVRADNAPEGTVTALPVTIMTTPADLTLTTLSCQDLDGEPLRPKDVIECTAHLQNLVGKEDAVGVTAQVPVLATTEWAPGGNETSHDSRSITWSALPGGVPSGKPDVPELRFRLSIKGDTWPGTPIAPVMNIFYKNADSGSAGSLSRVAFAMTSAPGPAVLTSSLLTCSDVNAAPLYAGDTISCALTAANAGGHEDLEDLRGLMPIPPGTAPLGGTLDGGGTNFVLDGALGTLPSGAAKTVILRLQVGGATAPGTRIAPKASLRGRSVGTGALVAHDVAAVPMTVEAPPAPLTPTPVAVAAASGGGGSPATPGKPVTKPTPKPTKDSRICKSRRNVTVTVWPPKGQRWKSVSAKYGPRTGKGKRWGTRRAYRVTLRFGGLPKGIMKVRIAGKTTAGKTVKSTRSFRLCLSRRKSQEKYHKKSAAKQKAAAKASAAKR